MATPSQPPTPTPAPEPADDPRCDWCGFLLALHTRDAAMAFLRCPGLIDMLMLGERGVDEVRAAVAHLDAVRRARPHS